MWENVIQSGYCKSHNKQKNKQRTFALVYCILLYIDRLLL